MSSIGLQARVWLGCCVVLALMTSGCSKQTEHGAIKGTVTVAGQPLAKGRIFFLPFGGPTVTAPIKNGEYSIPLSDGLVVGQSRIEVEATPDLGFELDDEQAYVAFAQKGGTMPPEKIPPEFNKKSILRAPIKPGENTLNVAIP